jgi:hypothetical protein
MMMQKNIAAIATLTSTLFGIQARPIQAVPVTYDFTVEVTQGSLAGNTFTGSFRYDDESVRRVGTKEIGVADGLMVNMTFFGQDYTEKADTGYPEYPKLILEDGLIQRLDFWIEPGERVVWWGQPGWKVELFPRNNLPGILDCR